MENLNPLLGKKVWIWLKNRRFYFGILKEATDKVITIQQEDGSIKVFNFDVVQSIEEYKKR